MIQDVSTGSWDTVRDGQVFPFRAENDSAFPENILGLELNKNLIEIMASLEKSRGWETEGDTELSSKNNLDIPKHSIHDGKSRAEDDRGFVENALLTGQNELNALIEQLEPQGPIPKEQNSQTDVASSPPSDISDFLDHTKYYLSVMKAFAAFARDKFRDPELGIRYQKAFLRRIDRAMALLNSYADYLRLSNPKRKTNTINSLFEKVLTKHTEQLKDLQIQIIKKQFEEDLPETTVPEAQLEYILDSLMQYITHSTFPHGDLGLLTRLVDDTKRSEGENDPLRKSRKYVEILFVFSTHGKKNDPTSSSSKGQGMELILRWVQEIIEKSKGVMEVRPSDKNAMTFISLKVPVERRTVFEFKPLRDGGE